MSCGRWSIPLSGIADVEAGLGAAKAMPIICCSILVVHGRSAVGIDSAPEREAGACYAFVRSAGSSSSCSKACSNTSHSSARRPAFVEKYVLSYPLQSPPEPPAGVITAIASSIRAVTSNPLTKGYGDQVEELEVLQPVLYRGRVQAVHLHYISFHITSHSSCA